MTAPKETRRAQPIIPWLLALIRGGVAEPGVRKRRVSPRAIVGASVLGVGVWLGATVYPQAIPEPRWTEADLPSLPAASDNGWHSVTSEALELAIPKSLGSLIGSRELESERFWAQVERDAELLREFLASEGAQEALARIEDARREVAFADACALEVKSTCQLIAWHQSHDVALLQALALAQAGRSTEALTLVRALLRMSAAQLESARSVLSLLVALDQLGDALHEAEMIVARIDRSGADAELRAELLAEVAAVEVDTLDLRAIVIGTYLHHRDALELTRDTWFYSHASTVRRVDQMHERRYQAAVNGDVFAALGGEERSPTQSLGWWLHNPGGKLVLEAMAFDPTSLAADIEESREDIRGGRARLLARAR
jgi:hypothetical protein